MEQLTTYRAKGKDIGLTFLFKYNLNGDLREFKVESGDLNGQQIKWLFSVRFPATEEMIKSNWIKDKELSKKFEITCSPGDVSFAALWNLYGHKHAKFHAEKAFSKLKEETVIKLFTSIPIYKKYLAHSGISQAHLATYINGKYYDNEY